jgi:hypothetical protein
LEKNLVTLDPAMAPYQKKKKDKLDVMMKNTFAINKMKG